MRPARFNKGHGHDGLALPIEWKLAVHFCMSLSPKAHHITGSWSKPLNAFSKALNQPFKMRSSILCRQTSHTATPQQLHPVFLHLMRLRFEWEANDTSVWRQLSTTFTIGDVSLHRPAAVRLILNDLPRKYLLQGHRFRYCHFKPMIQLENTLRYL